MKKIQLFILPLLSLIIISCKNKSINLRLEKSSNHSNNTEAYILDYTFIDDGGEKDTLIINAPLTFRLKNNSNNKFVYQTIIEAEHRYSPTAIINSKLYNVETIFDSPRSIYINPKSSSEITYYFQTPILKKTLEEEFDIKKLLNDKKLGDSIVIHKITPKIQEEINKKSNKDMFIIKIKNIDNNKNIGIRYCFNKDKAIIYDVDSLLQVNPRYMFSCDKDFY